MNKNLKILLAASFLIGFGNNANAAPQGFEWFPHTPGPHDPLYLLLVNPCTSDTLAMADHLTMRASHEHTGNSILKIRYGIKGMSGCLGAPPGITAIPIPREIDGVAIERLISVRDDSISAAGSSDLDAHTAVWDESLPGTFAIPPAIAGTWFSPDHAEQGLLVNMTAKHELLVGWTTYGADGKQRWFSGIAPTVPDESTVTLTLTDTGDGKFAGTLPNDTAASDWGTLTIQYVACGEIDIRWNPNAGTGLQSGSATMQQLTQPHDAACDLASYAAALGQQLTIHSLDIETAP